MIDSEASVKTASEAPPSWRILHEVDVAGMVAQHATVRGLCGALEDCADRLPASAAIVEGIRISAALAASLRRDDLVEKLTLRGLCDTDANRSMKVLLARIRHRHAVDHLHAEDLHDALVAAARTPGPARSDTLSYMMRCLFDGCRRGIDFQEAVILLLAGDRLTPAARTTLSASLTGAT